MFSLWFERSNVLWLAIEPVDIYYRNLIVISFMVLSAYIYRIHFKIYNIYIRFRLDFIGFLKISIY